MTQIELKPGLLLNDTYQIDELIGSGGMSEVYKGHNIQTLDPVAIKVILPKFATNEKFISLFRKEALVLNRLNHEAIVRYHVFTVDRKTDLTYLAMEFVKGPSLDQMVKERPLTLPEAAKMIARIASGLEIAHREGVVHRDISLDNIILADGNIMGAKLIDFGISKSGAGYDQTLLGGVFAGKYNYVSPEQLGLFGGDVGPASDVYSLGLVLAASLTGQPLNMSGSHADVIEKRRSVPDLVHINPAVRPLLKSMLAPNPAFRMATMAQVVQGLQPFLASSKTRQPGQKRSEAAAMQTRYTENSTSFSILSYILGSTVILAAGYLLYTAYSLNIPTPESAEGEAAFAQETVQESQAAAPKNETRAGVETTAETEPAYNRPLVVDEGVPEPDTQEDMYEVEQSIVAQGPTATNMPSAPSEIENQDPQLSEKDLWLAEFDGGPCFYSHIIEDSPSYVRILGYGQTLDPFQKLEASFSERFSFEPMISVRPVKSGHCPVLDMISEPEIVWYRGPSFNMQKDLLSRDDSLLASLYGLELENVLLLIIDENGAILPLDSQRNRFANQISLALKFPAPPKKDRESFLLFALETKSAPVISDLALQAGASSYFAELRQLLKSDDYTPAYALLYFERVAN